MMNNSAIPFGNQFGRLPEKESPPGPYLASGTLPPFSEALAATEQNKHLSNMNIGIHSNTLGTAEQIQVQMLPHQVRHMLNIFLSTRKLCIPE